MSSERQWYAYNYTILHIYKFTYTQFFDDHLLDFINFQSLVILAGCWSDYGKSSRAYFFLLKNVFTNAWCTFVLKIESLCKHNYEQGKIRGPHSFLFGKCFLFVWKHCKHKGTKYASCKLLRTFQSTCYLQGTYNDSLNNECYKDVLKYVWYLAYLC